VPLKANERRDPPDLKRAQTIDKGHGRLETRSIAVRTKLLRMFMKADSVSTKADTLEAS
jgi:hypothetical protein